MPSALNPCGTSIVLISFMVLTPNIEGQSRRVTISCYLAAQPLRHGRRLLVMRLHPVLALAFVSLATSSLPAQAPIVATTGAPELNETSVSGISFAMTETDYQKEAQRLATDARFIPMRTKPAGLSAKAQFGASFVLDEKNRSWIIDGDAAKGYTFYGDFNGNGDLADDGPRTFVDEQGKPTLRISQEGRSDEGGTHRILMKLQLDQMAKPDGSGKAFALVRVLVAAARWKGARSTRRSRRSSSDSRDRTVSSISRTAQRRSTLTRTARSTPRSSAT